MTFWTRVDEYPVTMYVVTVLDEDGNTVGRYKTTDSKKVGRIKRMVARK